MSWEMVDEGWGRRAADFAAMTEPAACREYVAVHHRVGVDAGDRLLDVACGSGLALELAALRGAACAGIDASERLVTIARDRIPDADVRVGDMNARLMSASQVVPMRRVVPTSITTCPTCVVPVLMFDTE